MLIYDNGQLQLIVQMFFNQWMPDHQDQIAFVFVKKDLFALQVLNT
jgi:hypothetical protein